MDSEVVQKIQAALGCGRLGRGHFNRGGTGAGGGGIGSPASNPGNTKNQDPGPAVLSRAFPHLSGACLGKVAPQTSWPTA